jgi:hypothetical protein
MDEDSPAAATSCPPAGIDVNVLKTGGVTAMNFDIPMRAISRARC